MVLSRYSPWFLLSLLLTVALAAFLHFMVLSDVPFGIHYDEAVNGKLARAALETGRFQVFYPENKANDPRVADAFNESLTRTHTPSMHCRGMC